MKNYTKGANLAKKRELRENAPPQGIPELKPVVRQAKQGKSRVREIQSEIPAIQKRCRDAGVEEITQRDVWDAKAPWNGCHAGQAMSRQVIDRTERSDLWSAIQHIRKTWVHFDAAIGSPNRHAQCLRLLLPIERFETSADAPAIDDRTDDEKYRQAVSAKMAVEGWLGYVDKYAASVCKQVVIDDLRCNDPPALVRSLRCVVDGIKGNKMVYRGC